PWVSNSKYVVAPCLLIIRTHCRILSIVWKSALEQRPSVGGVLRVNIPPMRFHDGSRNGQPESHSIWLRAEEEIEHARKFLYGNARPIVRNGHLDRFVVEHRCADNELAVFRHLSGRIH